MKTDPSPLWSRIIHAIAGFLPLQRTASENRQPVGHRFEYQSVINAPASAVWNFHNRPTALQELTPPPIRVEIIWDERVSLTDGVLDFILWFGPLPIRWVARHEPGDLPESFRDQMEQGPLNCWTHDHQILDRDDHVILADHLRFQYHSGWRGLAGWLFFNPVSLRILFAYRHWRTRKAILLDRNKLISTDQDTGRSCFDKTGSAKKVEEIITGRGRS